MKISRISRRLHLPNMNRTDSYCWQAKAKLGPRERRQLRNKVSARNFRIRRKEYITHLESLVAQQSSETSELRSQLEKLR